jgi:hypothetical protein
MEQIMSIRTTRVQAINRPFKKFNDAFNNRPCCLNVKHGFPYSINLHVKKTAMVIASDELQGEGWGQSSFVACAHEGE